MNQDEFAFLNQQLAGMLRTGLPLEGALKQLSATMPTGTLRGELERLGGDLAQGTPLREAVARRRLPDLYIRLVQVGAAGNDLAGMLTLLADYYRQRHSLWTRLKGLLVYPAIVLVVALAVSCLAAGVYHGIFTALGGGWQQAFGSSAEPLPSLFWLPVVWVGLALVLFSLGLVLPRWRRWLLWHAPGFREASLAQFGSAMNMLLAAGTQLGEALGLVQAVEGETPLGRELRQWQGRLAAGQGKFSEFAAASRLVPPLFCWLVAQGGEDLAGGFGRAAEIYYGRARHRVEMLLYAFLPVAVMVLGGLILFQLSCLMRPVITMMNALGGM